MYVMCVRHILSIRPIILNMQYACGISILLFYSYTYMFAHLSICHQSHKTDILTISVIGLLEVMLINPVSASKHGRVTAYVRYGARTEDLGQGHCLNKKQMRKMCRLNTILPFKSLLQENTPLA
jgi:hypothetical protein